MDLMGLSIELECFIPTAAAVVNWRMSYGCDLTHLRFRCLDCLLLAINNEVVLDPCCEVGHQQFLSSDGLDETVNRMGLEVGVTVHKLDVTAVQDRKCPRNVGGRLDFDRRNSALAL
eukprot:5816816-Amphidinium_carterae.2